MRDKHLHHPEDSALLRRLRAAVTANGLLPARRARSIFLLKAAFYFPLLTLLYAGIFWAENAPLFFTAFIGYGLTSVLVGFNFAHDLSHRTIFKSAWLNDAAFTSLYALVGAHAEAWRDRHVGSHHYAPNVGEYDADLQITTLIRVDPGAPRRPLHRWQYLYALPLYSTYSLFWIFVKDARIFRQDILSGTGKGWRYHLSFWAQKVGYIGYLLVLPLVAAHQPWWMVVTAFLAMHAIQSLFLLLTFFITHHVESTAYFGTNEDGQIEASWLTNQVRSSNDFYPFSTAANFLFGGFNNHIAHHLFPHIASVHYPRLSRTIYAVLLKKGIVPNQTGYFSGVASHLRHLRALGRAADDVRGHDCDNALARENATRKTGEKKRVLFLDEAHGSKLPTAQ